MQTSFLTPCRWVIGLAGTQLFHTQENRMLKRKFLLMIAALAMFGMSACTTTTPKGEAPSSRKASIDAGADRVLADLYKQVPGTRDLVSRAKGVLVFPNTVSAGLGVGGSYGEGVLRKGNRVAGYYNTLSAQFGLIAGAQSKAVFMLFMTDEALNRFEASRGWTVGADASVAVITVGANAAIDSKTVQQPIVGFVLTNAGLMANATIDGTKITKLDL
jgi:lipid-binding SYLF domain-containing protein